MVFEKIVLTVFVVWQQYVCVFLLLFIFTREYYHKHREERAASRKWPISSLEPIYKLWRCTRSGTFCPPYVRLIPVLEVVLFVDCHSTKDMLVGSKKCLKSSVWRIFLIEMLLCLCCEGTRLKPIEIGLQTNQHIAFASQIIIAHVVCRIIVLGVMLQSALYPLSWTCDKLFPCIESIRVNYLHNAIAVSCLYIPFGVVYYR